MQCFMCGTQVEGRHRKCPACGADILLYKQIIYTSYLYYNQGLEKANVGDLSGAIEALKTAVQYYKYNTRARNLLGLCYYQVGESVRALNEWVLSKNLQENDNPDADRYLAEMENAPGLLNKLNTSFKKYNQAIEYCKNGSRDLAIIQLKKVISQNPNYVRAHQLLALLYMKEGKLPEARKTLAAAAKIDNNNTTTIRYIREVKVLLKEQNTGKKPRRNAFEEDEDIGLMSDSGFMSMVEGTKTSLINIIIGLVLGVLVCYFLVVPTVRSHSNDSSRTTILALNEELDTEKSKNEDLNSQVSSLTESLDAYTNKQDISTSYDNLLEASNYYNAGDLTSACASIELVTKDVLGTAGQEAYDNLYTLLQPTMLESYYNEGNNFYLEENYTSAITNFQQVVDLDETYQDGAALFLLADCYRLTEDTDTALEYYQKVVELFPKNEWGKQAQTYIDAGGNAVSVDSEGDFDQGSEEN